MIDICHKAVQEVIDTLPFDFEVIYVNDGSADSTLEKLEALHQVDPRITVLSLSRNFGKEAAMTAGIDHVNGDALIILDADLQDPPALIPDLINMWKETNADVVYGQRVVREGESFFKKFTALAFYNVINVISSSVSIPKNTGDFRLMNRRAINALTQLREKHRFMKGLFAWIGYKQVALRYNRAPRAAGKTKWNYYKLWNFGLEGIAAFSTTPLRFATLTGAVISMFSFLFGGYILIDTLLYGNPTDGWPSIIVLITFLSGIQLLTIGILGEYIGRIFGESKKRPLYFIDTVIKKD